MGTLLVAQSPHETAIRATFRDAPMRPPDARFGSHVILGLGPESGWPVKRCCHVARNVAVVESIPPEIW